MYAVPSGPKLTADLQQFAAVIRFQGFHDCVHLNQGSKIVPSADQPAPPSKPTRFTAAHDWTGDELAG